MPRLSRSRFLFLGLFFWFSLVPFGGVHGQDLPPYYMGTFGKNAAVMLFADDVNLREKPDPKSKVLARLPMASRMTILSEPQGEFEANGFSGKWYKVGVEGGKTKVEGFLWGGFIALGARSWKDGDRDLSLLVGIVSREDVGFKAEARVVEAGKVISREAFPLVFTDMGGFKSYNYGIELEEISPPRLKKMDREFRLRMFYEACGYENGLRLLFWNGKTLIVGPLASSVSEAGLFSVQSDFEFPGSPSRDASSEIVVKTLEKSDEEKRLVEKVKKYVLKGKVWEEGPETTRPLEYQP